MSDFGAGGGEEVVVKVAPEIDAAAAAKAERDLSNVIEKASRGIKGSKGFESVTKDLDAIVAGAARASGAVKDFSQATKAAERTLGANSGIDQFGDDIEILRKRIEATRKTLQQSGADPDLFGSLDVQLRKLLKFQAEVEASFKDLANNDELRKAANTRLSALGKAITGELTSVNRALTNVSKQQASASAQVTAGIQAEGRVRQAAIKKETAEIAGAANAQNVAQRNAGRERLALINKERAEFVVAEQREGAQVLAETRATNQRRLQQERAFQRTRVELLRFTFNQIRTLERAVGSIFSGTVNIVQRAVSGIGSQAQRLGKIFRSGNRDLNDGLQPALLSRERDIQRSFERQNSIVRSSVIEQSRTIERFQAQASRGVAGVATGRSGLGSLLGGGLAFGGGFLVLDKLKAGFDEAVNFNEALNKVRVVLGDASGDIEEFANNSVAALFSTRSEALAAAANFAVFGKAAGLQGKPLAEFSKKLTLLATDLASFSNTDVETAVTAIGAALRGESEPIRQYGVLLDDATLRQRAFELGITDTVRQLRPSERVLAAYNLILEQTTDAQGDAARTADDFANSSRRAAAASVETAASIAKAFVPIATFFTNFTFKTLPKLTAFIEGNVGPGLTILRDGLIGAGEALAVLIAARGAVEVIQFLALALRAVLTPMGLFVAAVAGIGAAIKIFQDRSPAFASAVRTITSTITDVLGQGIDLVNEGLDFLGQLIDNTVLPALGRLAQVAGRGLRTALQFGIGFVVSVIIPGFKLFAHLLTDTVLPALEDFGGEILDHVGPALRFLRDTAGDALDKILPLLQPAIDGFEQLAGAIIGAATAAGSGDFSGIAETLKNFVQNISAAQIASAVGAGAIGTAVGGPIGGAIGVALGLGLGNSLKKIGDIAVDALRPQLDKVADFINGFLTEDRLQKAAVGILQFTRTVGRIIGDVITDPLVLRALEGIVALGAALIEGFIEGVVRNIPELTRVLAHDLEFLFNEAFKLALSHPETIAKIFAAIFVGGVFINSIRRNMQGAGEQAATGFIGGFGRTIKGAFSRNQFAAGFFGGESNIQAEAARVASKAAKTVATERDRAFRNLQRLGGSTDLQRLFVGGADGIAVTATNAGKELDKLTEKVGAARAQGALLRTQLGDVFTGGFKNLGRNIGDVFANLKGQLREAGTGLGTAIGGTILAGVGAALSGQQLGSATSGTGRAVGLAGLLSSALFASASLGGPETGVGALAGGVVLAIGGITAALSSASEAAKKAAAETNEYVEALKGLKGTEAATAATQTVLENIGNESQGVRDLLLQVGFNARRFSDDVIAGTFDVEEAIGDLAPAFGSASADIISALGPVLAQGIDIRDAFRRAAGPIAGLPPALRGLHTAIAGLSPDQINVIVDAFDALLDESSELRKGLDVEAEAAQFRTDAVEAADAVTLSFTKTADAIERAGGEGGSLGERIKGAVDVGFAAISRGIVKVDDFGNKFIEVGQDITDGLGGGVDKVGQALDLLNSQRLDGLSSQIDGVRNSLTEAKDAVQQTLDGIKLLAGGALTDPLQQAADQLTVSLPSVGEAIRDALTDTSRGAAFDQAQINEVLRPFQDQINALFSQAVDTFGANLTPDKLREIFAPVQATLDTLTLPTDVTDAEGNVTVQEIAVPPEVKAQLQKVIDDLVANPDVDAQVQTLALQQGAVDQLNEDLTALNAQLPVEVIFDADQVLEALQTLFPGEVIPIDAATLVGRQLGARPFGTESGTPSRVAAAEANADPQIRASLAALAARDLGPQTRTSADATEGRIVVQGDIVAQKIDNQNFNEVRDSGVSAAELTRQARTAAAGLSTTISQRTGGRLGG